jgi:hypothetical protein
MSKPAWLSYTKSIELPSFLAAVAFARQGDTYIMRGTLILARILVAVAGIGVLLLGLTFWTGSALDLLPVHKGLCSWACGFWGALGS